MVLEKLFTLKISFNRTIKNFQNGSVYTKHLYVQICVQILCRILIFNGLNGHFKITATTQYITRIKNSTNKEKSESNHMPTFLNDSAGQRGLPGMSIPHPAAIGKKILA